MIAGTLARAGERWDLVEFDAMPLAERLLQRPLIAGAWDDQDRLQASSLTELAHDSSVTAGVPTAELVDPDADVTHQLLDLSVVDGRYLPALIEAGLVHLIDAWEQATTGSDHPLTQRTSPQAREQLLYPTQTPTGCGSCCAIRA
jgi:hypothetical protein